MAPGAGTSSIRSAWVTFLLVLSACTSDGPLDGSPPASVQVAQAECPSVELHGPGGAEPNLSGTWIGIGEHGASVRPGTYEFNLLNSCVAWVGRSTEEGEALGASWVNVFLGEVNPDFTISGDWAVVSSGEAYCETGRSGALCDRARGTLILRIEWPDPTDASRVRLVLQEDTKIGVGPGGIGDFVTGIWVRPGDEDLFDLPVN